MKFPFSHHYDLKNMNSYVYFQRMPPGYAKITETFYCIITTYISSNFQTLAAVVYRCPCFYSNRHLMQQNGVNISFKEFHAHLSVGKMKSYFARGMDGLLVWPLEPDRIEAKPRRNGDRATSIVK
jgi:hypothetical protein